MSTYHTYTLHLATSRWSWMGLHLNVERVLALKNHPLLEGDDKKSQKLRQVAQRLRASLIESEGCLPARDAVCELAYTLEPVPRRYGEPSVRWTSRGKVNLLTIPWRTPGSRLVGGCISPPRGHTWFTAGWKRPDIWAVANLTRHPKFLEFATAEDPHEWLADKLWIPKEFRERVRSDLRRAVFSILYNPSGKPQATGLPEDFPHMNAIRKVLLPPAVTFGGGYTNPYSKDPFGRKLPEQYKYPMAFQKLLVDMALAEVYVNHRAIADLAFMLPETMLWEVRDEHADEFEGDMRHRLTFQEVGRGMEWALLPEPEVTRVRDLSDYFGG